MGLENTKVYKTDGGNKIVVASGGTLQIDSGATFTNGLATAVANLTDNSGGAAADGTIGVVTAPTALTHSVGTADNTVADVGAVYDQTTLNNNFKELTTAQAANRTAIVALTDAVKELATKLNAALAALRTSGALAT